MKAAEAFSLAKNHDLSNYRLKELRSRIKNAADAGLFEIVAYSNEIDSEVIDILKSDGFMITSTSFFETRHFVSWNLEDGGEIVGSGKFNNLNRE